MTKDDFIFCTNHYTPNLIRYARRVSGNVLEAADVVQECFEALWKNKDKVEIALAKSYLFSVAHRKIVDSFRSEFTIDKLESASDELTTNQENKDSEDLVWFAINSIPAVYRELIILRDLESYSYKEIEEIVHLTESQVKVYLFRARKAIREKILQLETI